MKQIIFIRHGEKTKKDNINLSSIGYKRAEELINYFQNLKSVQMPEKIIAMKQNHKDSSDRAYQTILPLANNLNIKITSKFKNKEFKDLVEYLKKSYDSSILVCWEHYFIPEIIYKLFDYKENLTWGLNPKSDIDSDNYTVWVISNGILSVYKQSDIIEKNGKFIIYGASYKPLKEIDF